MENYVLKLPKGSIGLRIFHSSHSSTKNLALVICFNLEIIGFLSNYFEIEANNKSQIFSIQIDTMQYSKTYGGVRNLQNVFSRLKYAFESTKFTEITVFDWLIFFFSAARPLPY